MYHLTRWSCMIDPTQVDPSMDAIEKVLVDLEEQIGEIRKCSKIARENAAASNFTLTEWALTPIAQAVDEIRNAADTIEGSLPIPY
jgi:hypothetical protein